MGLKLGDISPLAAAVTGEGFATNFGLLPAMRARQVEREKAESAAAAANAAKEEEAKAKQEQDLMSYKKQNGFKKGGSVKSASSRADGCAMRGKTRGKIY
jgi:hypothetical protein